MLGEDFELNMIHPGPMLPNIIFKQPKTAVYNSIGYDVLDLIRFIYMLQFNSLSTLL